METLQEDIRHRYFLQCGKQVSLPLLHKIKGKVLNLTNYQVSEGVLRAFVSALRPSEAIFNRVVLENNGFRQEEMNLLLNGLKTLADLKSFVCIRNEFGLSSVESIAPVLARPLPG